MARVVGFKRSLPVVKKEILVDVAKEVFLFTDYFIFAYLIEYTVSENKIWQKKITMKIKEQKICEL